MLKGRNATLDYKTIKRLHANLIRTGSVTQQKGAGRPKTVITRERMLMKSHLLIFHIRTMPINIEILSIFLGHQHLPPSDHEEAKAAATEAFQKSPKKSIREYQRNLVYPMGFAAQRNLMLGWGPLNINIHIAELGFSDCGLARVAKLTEKKDGMSESDEGGFEPGETAEMAQAIPNVRQRVVPDETGTGPYSLERCVQKSYIWLAIPIWCHGNCMPTRTSCVLL
ncbi:hypothetical protein ANN_03620 [Periplaneta americana]|uniref:Uncharacterized protein n=1 Tax=Periplaneta americana TaxID=6978 RepID=A0ABQ8U3T3_PERAM|nr:hypothetical protein ANN_03620 [Periplaneta americana]